MSPSESTGSTATLAAAKPQGEAATESKSEPQDSEAAVDSMVGNMVKHLAAAKHTAVDEEECEDDAKEDEMQVVKDDAAEEAETPKPLGRGRPKGAAKAKPKAFKGPKPTGKEKAKAKAKTKAAPVASTATLPPRSVMRFVDTKFHAPRHWGQCTVYTDMTKKCWRLKLKPGNRHEKYFIWGKSPRDVWNRMIEAILEQHKAD